jgi:fibronectin type 3 domain-containing protein
VKHFIPVLLPVVLFLACVQRDDEVGSRSNPYDAGGDSWKINSEPTVDAVMDSGWADFDYSDSVGTVHLHIKASDQNIPVDTLQYSVIVTSGTDTLLRTVTHDSVLLIGNLTKGGSYLCRVIATDLDGASDTQAVTFTTPDLPPPPRPSPYIIPGATYISINWPVVQGVDEYHVYSSSKVSGPFTLLQSIKQRASGTIAVTDTPDGYDPVFYLVSSANGYGESFSPDTLLGRRFYSGISTPSIYSISQGTYKNYIRIQIYSYYQSSISRYEIYRSVDDTFNFRLVGYQPNSSRSSSYLYYYDTVTTKSTYYYKVAAIDKNNRSSKMSDSEYGYLQRLSAPSFYSSSSTNYTSINLSWSSVSGAVYYRIYRSPVRCSDTMPVFDSTVATSYYDTVPTSDYYYYSISAVETGGYEGTRSSCVSRKVQILPAPSGFSVASGTRVNSISMSWSSVNGAFGYIIYRSANQGDTYEPVDTVSWNSYIDSVVSTDTYYYRVAAYNERGIGAMSSYQTGYTVRPPTLSATSTSSSTIELSWSTVSSAQMFYIYRGTTTTSFVLIDSTLQNSFSDVPPEYKEYYYRLTMRISGEITGPGNITSATRLRAEPTGLTVTELADGCLITWDSYAGADGYRLSRSTSSSSTTFYQDVTDTFYMDVNTTTTRYYYKVAAMLGSITTPYTATIRGGKLQVPLTPGSISATGTTDGISLTWNISSSSSIPTGFIITRSTGSTANPVVLDSTTEMSYFDPVPDTARYYYQIAAYNNAGTGFFSSFYSAKRQTPLYPSSITATQGTYASKIVISWQRVPEVSGYRCYRSTSTSGTYSLIATTADTMFVDTSVISNVVCYYKVSSFKDSIAGAMSPLTTGMRLGPPSSITITSQQTGVLISWTSVPVTVQRFYIYRSGTPTGTFVKIDSVPGSLSAYHDINVPEGNNYYRVSSGNLEESTPGPVSAAGHLQFPSVPSTITATKGTQTNLIAISWSRVSGAAGYRLYRSTSYGADSGLVLLATQSDAMYNDTVATDSMYFYRVKAFNNGGESALSTGFAGGFRLPSAKPEAPSGVITESVNNNIRITWDPPSSKTGYTGFNIYRSLNQNGSDSTVFQTTVPLYDDLPPLSFPTQYWYRITAVNQEGESDFSAAAAGARE